MVLLRNFGFAVGKRFISSSSNNVTSYMGLDPNNTSKTALITADRRLTYADLSKLVGSTVSHLSSKYVLERGDRLVARVEKSIESLALYLAVVRLGAIYVPLNPAYTSAETSFFLKDCMPKLFVSCKSEDECFLDVVPQIVDSTALQKEAIKEKPDYGIENVSSTDTACICYTSGTTGLPKGVMLSHGGLKWNADSLISLWRFTSSDILLHSLPFYHVHGMFISLNCSLLTQSSVIWSPKFSIEDTKRWLPHCTVMMGVPTYYSRLLRDPDFGSKYSQNVRLFVSGSAPLSPSHWHEFKARTGSAILERYGMTEAVSAVVIASNGYNEDERIPGSAGKILAGGEMRISKSNVVEIRLPSLFTGYYKNPEKTETEFTKDGFFITGDLGRIDDNGFLWILGRNKDLVISGGLNIYPKEVEDALDSLPFISETAVIGVPHSDFGEVPIAVCVAKDEIPSNKMIIDGLSRKIAKYKIPKKFIFVAQMPRNSMGKVKKDVLREKYRNCIDNA